MKIWKSLDQFDKNGSDLLHTPFTFFPKSMTPALLRFTFNFFFSDQRRQIHASAMTETQIRRAFNRNSQVSSDWKFGFYEESKNLIIDIIMSSTTNDKF